MFCYGVLILLVGVALLAGAGSLAVGLHRRFQLPYVLLTVGILTYIGALLVQVVLLRAFDPGLLGLLPIGALAIGVAAGFSEETARLLGYQVLARSAVTKPQALMIGLGHGFTETLYTGVFAAGLGLSLLGYGSEHPDDLAALLRGALAEALNGILPVVMHMALSWVVLQVLLRGELVWLFVAIFCHAIVEMMAVLLGPSDAWAVVVWRTLIALVSLGVIRWLHAPRGDPEPANA